MRMRTDSEHGENLQRSPTARRPATILIVEDQPDQLVLMIHVLTAAGFRVVPAEGGEDGLQKLKKQKIDLVLTDLAMPNVSGVQVIAAVKSDPETRAVPVVVVSGYTWDEIGNAALAAGADCYIGKPFSAERLIREVRKHFRAAPVRAAIPLPSFAPRERPVFALDLLRRQDLVAPRDTIGGVRHR